MGLTAVFPKTESSNNNQRVAEDDVPALASLWPGDGGKSGPVVIFSMQRRHGAGIEEMGRAGVAGVHLNSIGRRRPASTRALTRMPPPAPVLTGVLQLQGRHNGMLQRGSPQRRSVRCLADGDGVGGAGPRLGRSRGARCLGVHVVSAVLTNAGSKQRSSLPPASSLCRQDELFMQQDGRRPVVPQHVAATGELVVSSRSAESQT